MADAVWKGNASFDQLVAAADNVLMTRPGDITSIANVGIVMARVARKVGRTSEIEKYLEAGANITYGEENNKIRDWHITLLADQALYVNHDTAKAITIKKDSFDPNWESVPSKYYSFARWCLERKINLVEAENLANKAVSNSPDGKFKASTLATLAGVLEARGKKVDAVRTMKQAVDQDPHNTWYQSELKRLQG